MTKENKKSEIMKQIRIRQIYTFLLLIVIGLITTGIYSLGRTIPDDSSVKGANTFVVNKINENFTTKYFSKPLGIELSFDNRFFSLSQKDEYLTISTIDKNSVIKNSTLRVASGKEIQEIYPNLTQLDSIQDNGVGKSVFSFEKVSLLDKSNYEVDYLSVIYKKFPNNQIIYLQIWGYDFRNDMEYTKLLSQIVESSNFSEQESVNSGVLSATASLVNQGQILGQASTVRIFSKECNNVKFSDELYSSNIGGKTYVICTASFGSGFVVNDNGYVVTNAHVANGNNLDSLIDGWSIDGTFETDFVGDLIAFLQSEYDQATLSQITEEDMANFVIVLLTELHNEGYITITDKDREIYIQGNDVFKNNLNTGELLDKESHFKANLVKSNDLSSYYKSVLSEDTSLTEVADLAILQVEGDFNFPSIPILSSGFSTGQTIYVVGYPGLADDSELISSTEVLSSSVTKGSISAIKPNTNNTYDLIQIDAAIQGGNSGGPIIDENGKVVGVATYSMSSDSGNFNYGVSAKEVVSFLSNSSVEMQVNSMRSSLEDSLADASLGYYKRALESLQGTLLTQPTLTVTLQPIVDLCEDKILAGEDKTPLVNTNNKILMIAVIVLLVILLIVAIIFLSINIKRISLKKKELSKAPNLMT